MKDFGINMNEQIKLLAEQCGFRSNPNIYDRNQSFDIEKFAELIVKHILLKMESEIALAYEQDQSWTAATLEALALEILDDFDMEIKDDESTN